MKKQTYLLASVLSLIFSGQTFGQTGQRPALLAPGKPINRQIAGGQTHTYQITLKKGQFARVAVESKAINVTLALTPPGGKPAPEINLTGVGGVDPLSWEAAVNGAYRLAIKATGAPILKGSYQARLEVKATATEQDRERMGAERTLAETDELVKPGGASAQQAIEKLNQALQVWRKLGDKYWETYTLDRMGRAYQRLGRHDQAIQSLEQALAISRETKNRPGEAFVLNNLGASYYSISRFEKAIECFEQTLAIKREVKDREGEGGALINLGACANILSCNEQAIAYQEQALAIMREVKNRRAEGYVLTNLGNANASLGRHDKGIEYNEKALAIFLEVKDRINEAVTLGNLGASYSSFGQNEKAIEYYEQALAISRETKDRYGEGKTLGSLGGAYFSLSRYDQAIEYLEQSLQIRREIKDRIGEGGALSALGNVYTATGRYEKAIECLEQSIAIRRAVKDRKGEAGSLSNLSIVYDYLKRQDKAIEYLEQAQPIQREIKDLDGQGRTLNNLGTAYGKLGLYEKAIEYREQALAIIRELKDRDSEGSVIGNLGNAYTSLKHYEKAIEHFGQALAISREVKNRAVESRTLESLGGVHSALKLYDKAAEYFGQALAIKREIKDRGGEKNTLLMFAIAERDHGNLIRALSLIEEALKLAESLRSEIYNPDLRATYFATEQGLTEFYIDLLMRLHQMRPGQGFEARALEVSERSRARGLLELLTEAGALIRQGADESLLERERALAQQLNAKAARQMQLLSRVQQSERKAEQSAALKQEISALEKEYEQVQVEIRKSSPRYAELTQPQPLKLKEIQQQLDKETLLLEYSLGADQSYLWAITSETMRGHELPGRAEIEATARRVYQLLTANNTRKRDLGLGGKPAAAATGPKKKEADEPGGEEYLEAAEKLSQMVLGPVTTQVRDGNWKRLVIVADGALQYIPFAALPRPRKDGSVSDRPLIVTHEIINLPSASTIAVLRRELSGRQPAPKTVAVIADPVFESGDDRLKAGAAGGAALAKTGDRKRDVLSERAVRTIAEPSADAESTGEIKLYIPRLPGTREEADRIVKLAPSGSWLKALDFQANRATATNPDLSQYRIVHWATHGFLDSESPGLSGLILSLVDEQGQPQDGFLRAHEVYNLKLPAELVVLSACQTGLGKEIKGEGVVGLTRGFMYAGAARLVVSLWSVNDHATTELMTKFYQKMLKDKQRPAAALRAAQIEMWKNKPWQEPYYWAAFVLQGEWR